MARAAVVPPSANFNLDSTEFNVVSLDNFPSDELENSIEHDLYWCKLMMDNLGSKAVQLEKIIITMNKGEDLDLEIFHRLAFMIALVKLVYRRLKIMEQKRKILLFKL